MILDLVFRIFLIVRLKKVIWVFYRNLIFNCKIILSVTSVNLVSIENVTVADENG